MIWALILAAALAGGPPLTEAAQALSAGRVDQAGAMIAAARQSGNDSEAVDRLAADQALASGANGVALTGYRALLVNHPDEPLLLERAALAAARLGDDAQAAAFVSRATASPHAGWRAWNLRAVLADRAADFAAADSFYARAAALAPSEASIANNRGWSLILRGDWAAAREFFDEALRLDPAVEHGAANRALAILAMSTVLPQRQPGESGDDYAARLNDAGVVAVASGDTKRAIAAFSQAIAARSAWDTRAAANLAALGAGAR